MPREWLCDLEPLHFDAAGANLRDVVVGLLREPTFSASPKAFESRTAISGEMSRFPFTSSDKVVRVTPSAAAAYSIVKPRGSMHWRNTKPPGCGGFFIGIDHRLSRVRILQTWRRSSPSEIVFGTRRKGKSIAKATNM